MNIYHVLNEITQYIDEHLEEEIASSVLAQMMGVNEYTMKRIFFLLANISISEYIRKRRLSRAGIDLSTSKCRVIDIAFKYQYENATSFSRAFVAFHGIRPSSVYKDKSAHLKNFPRIIFQENFPTFQDIDYRVVQLGEMVLYGVGIDVDNRSIGRLAPEFCRKTREQYESIYGEKEYGMVQYKDALRTECCGYYILWSKEISGFKRFVFPPSKWLSFFIPSRDPKDIQKISKNFYAHFLPSSQYNLRNLPELEYYHGDTVEFLVPII